VEGAHPVTVTWDLETPKPVIWPPGDKWERKETPLALSPDFDFWQYRVKAGLQWADVTGQWPQPPWRTRLDRLYYRLVAEARAITDARDNPGA
jgi:hypothetical protein